MEGVMMRGQGHMALAIREPSGNILVHEEPLTSFFYTHKIARWPFIRGITMLWDARIAVLPGAFTLCKTRPKAV